MKAYNYKTIPLLLVLFLVSCASGPGAPSGEDDGSGAVYERMGIKEPRSLDYQASDFHLTQVGKILFTDDINLNPEKAEAEDFKTSFKAGEVIKGVAYLDGTSADNFGLDAFPILKYSVGNKTHNWEIETYRNYDQTLTFLEFFIAVPLEDYIPTKGGPSTIANSMETLSQLKNEVYTLDAQLLHANGSSTGVEGQIEFDATNMKSESELAKEIKQIRIAHVSALPQPEPKMSDSKIEKQLVEHFNDMGWEEQFFKTIILSDEFNYKKSYAGIIVARTLSVAMVSKIDGHCMYQDFTVISQKTDDGYGKFKRYSTGSQYGCSCD